jgi:hypothetical protein
MRRIFGIAALSGVLFFTMAWTQAAPQQKAPKGKVQAVTVGNANAISQDELKEYIYFLSSDLMEGRYAPSRGYDTAALYIASNLKKWGVKPGGSQIGTEGPLQPYLMPIELTSSSLDAAGMKLSLVVPAAARGGRGGAGAQGGGGAGAPPAAQAGPREYEYMKEWTISAGGGFGGGARGGGAPSPAEIVNAQLAFVGNGYIINKTNANPYQDLDVRGKVMIVAGQPAEVVKAAQAQQAAMAAARDGQELALALREVGAVRGDFGLVSPWQALDERVRVGLFGRADALVIGGVQPAVAYVLHHRPGEEARTHEAFTHAGFTQGARTALNHSFVGAGFGSCPPTLFSNQVSL